MARQSSLWQIEIGLLALAVGIVLYVFDRPSAQIYFVTEWLSQYRGSPSLFGAIGYHLPTFLHVFAFCLITSGILATGRRGVLVVCLSWLLVDGGFEIGQHPLVTQIILPWIPDWFARVPVLDNTADYFIQGRFDPLDLSSIALGAFSAYLVIGLLNRQDDQADKQARQFVLPDLQSE